MKKYTEKELEAFERDEHGWLICPTGDYSAIKTFPGKCSFGTWCSHEGLTNSIYVAFDRIGSELRKTYFFKANEGYFVRAGCFF